MFCESCGSRFEEGTLVCMSCGRERTMPSAAARPQQVDVREQIVMEGPQCGEHPGMPLLGECPRCKRQVCVRCAPDAVNDVLTCTRCYGLTAAHQQAPRGATCATHPNVSADFICSRCGTFACSACQATGYGSEGLCVKCRVSAGTLASRGSRFGANLIDNMVVLLPAIVAAMFAGVVSSARDGLQQLALFGMFGGVAAGAGIQIVAQLTWGQSIGKRLLAIQVVKVDGTPAELWRILLLRNLVSHAAAQLCGLYALVDALVIFGAESRCVHDYIAGTIVVDKPPDAT